MIFIVGYTFEFNNIIKPTAPTISIQEQLALSKQHKQLNKTIFDQRFINKNTYRLSRIQKIIKEDKTKIKYLFSNITDSSQPDIDLFFDSTNAGDDYIAAISGQSLNLKQTRQHILQTYESNTDF